MIGLIGNLSLGPLFMLNLNRSARYGFVVGIATSIGISIADGVLFALGFSGLLSLVVAFTPAKLILYLVGGIVLIGLGAHMILAKEEPAHLALKPKGSFLIIVRNVFFLAVSSPLAILYFMAASLSVLKTAGGFNAPRVIWGTLMVTLGTFTVLAIVALSASKLGMRFKKGALQLINKVTGLVLLGFGMYLCFLLVRMFVF